MWLPGVKGIVWLLGVGWLSTVKVVGSVLCNVKVFVGGGGVVPLYESDTVMSWVITSGVAAVESGIPA